MLGPLPLGAAECAAEVINNEWAHWLIRSWNSAGWFDLSTCLRDKLSKLVGGTDGETIITDTTSLNLFKVLASAVRIQQQDAPGRPVILTERDNFPTDIYIAEGISMRYPRWSCYRKVLSTTAHHPRIGPEIWWLYCRKLPLSK